MTQPLAPQATAASPEAPAAPGPRPSALRLWRERLRMGAFALDNLAYMLVRVPVGLWFGWLARRGQAARAEAFSQRMTLKWTGRVLRRLGATVTVEGDEHLRREGPLVVMSNHQAIYDIPLLLGFLGRPLGFVFKRELLRIPGLRFWMLRNGCVALDRDDPRAAAALYREESERLRAEGGCLVIFPEGTRSRDPEGALGEFRRGALRLAQAGALPIQPVVVEGTRHLVNAAFLATTPKGRRPVRLRVLPVREPPATGGPAAREFMETLRADMIRTRDELRAAIAAESGAQPPGA